MADEANVQRILEYLHQHSDQYGLDSLRQQLLDAGYAAEDVAAALERFESPAVEPEPAFEPLPATIAPPPASVTMALPEAEPPTLAPSAPLPAALPEAEQPALAPSDPLPAPDPEETIGRITAYLKQYEGSYELAVLRRQTLAAGYPPELVEAAISRRAQSPAPIGQTSFRSGWLPGCGIWAINFVLGVLVTLFAFTADPFGSTVNFFYALGPIILVTEFIGGFVLRKRGRAGLGNALIWGVIYSIITPILFGIIAVLLISACYQYFGVEL